MVLVGVRLRNKEGEEVETSVKTKEKVSEKREKSEQKFRLIIRLRNTCQVSTAYILLDDLCSIRGSGVSSIKCSKRIDR